MLKILQHVKLKCFRKHGGSEYTTEKTHRLFERWVMSSELFRLSILQGKQYLDASRHEPIFHSPSW